MALERTLSIIKPDAVAKNVIGQIYARFEGAGLKIVAAKMAHLSRARSRGASTRCTATRPFFDDLVSFMISGPVMIQVLEGEVAIAKNRELMGATDPKKADAGHDPRRLRRQHRRQRRARLRRRRDRGGRDRVLLRRHERCTVAERGSTSDDGQPARLRPRRARRLVRAARREGVSRDPAVSLDPPARRARLRGDVGPRQVVARQAGRGSPRSLRCRSPASRSAADGTVKWLFDVGAGDAVETVFIPEADRGTLCISSQAGCARQLQRSARPATRASAAT